MRPSPIAVALGLSLFLALTCFYRVGVVVFAPLDPADGEAAAEARSGAGSAQREARNGSNVSTVPTKRPMNCLSFRQAHPSRAPEKFDRIYGQHSSRWLDAYVIPDAQVIFCQIHKVGSTKWLRLLRWLDGQDYNMFPHWWFGNRPGNLTTLRHLGRKRALEMMFDPNWTKIVAIRDPLDRLRSAYFSKVARSWPLPNESAAVFARELNVTIEGLRTVSFADFLVRVENLMREHSFADPHWRKQSDACSLGHFKKCYDYVMFMDRDKSTHKELANCAMQAMLSKMSESNKHRLQNITETDHTKAAEREHRTDSTHDVWDFDLCRRALLLYTDDYNLFPIPRPTCHRDPPYVRWPS